jgi:chromosomal replication initiation ATPase DnaA
MSLLEALISKHKERRGRFDAAAQRQAERVAERMEQARLRAAARNTSTACHDFSKEFAVAWHMLDATPVSTLSALPCIHRIQAIVCADFGVTRIDMLSARRTADIVRPRQIAMYLARHLTRKGLPEIGRRFGGRDHTTVLHAERKIGALILVDPELKTRIAALTAKYEAESSHEADADPHLGSTPEVAAAAPSDRASESAGIDRAPV